MAFSEDLFEPDFNTVVDKGKDSQMENALEWVASSSKVLQMRETVNDLMLSRICSSKRTKGVSTSPLQNSRRSSLASSRMSSLSDLSQGIVESVTVTLDKLNNFDFNIFELDELVPTKTLHYMTHELFDRFEFFDELVDEQRYKNFISEIIAGYDRSIVYHNDLHAGDVMQTVYLMLEKGNIAQVT